MCCDNDCVSLQSCDRVKARRAHRCGECGGTIRPGETYVRWNTLSDGAWSVDVFCAGCDAVSDGLHKAIREAGDDPMGCDLWCFGELWQHVAEWCREVLGYDPAADEAEEAA